MSKLGYISGIVDGNYNNPEYLASNYQWCYHWCILCGVCLEDTDDGVRESKVCSKCSIDKAIELNRVVCLT